MFHPCLASAEKPGIAAIRLMTQKILTFGMKEIVADLASGGMWKPRTMRLVSRNGVDRSTPGNIGNYIGIFETSSPYLIGIIVTVPPCSLNLSQEVGNIRKSTSPELVRKYHKLDAAADRKFSDNRNVTSIFSKIIGDKISNSSSQDIYMHCRMNITANPVQISTPQFVDLGILTINALD